MTPLLSLSDVHVAYQAVPALSGVSLEIFEGDVRVILGSNGAGKTTIIKSILGLVRGRQGEIRYQGEHDLRRLKPHQIHRLGIAWVPEGRQLWGTLTVLDNLRMGGYAVADRAAIEQRIEEMFERFPRLRERQQQLAGSLSGGEQQMVAIARALVSGPKLLLMDEPSLGLAPIVVSDVFKLVGEINRMGISILMVEQNARQALKVARFAYLLEVGRMVGSGSADEMAATEQVQEIFLGGQGVAMELLLQQIANGVVIGSTYAVVAIGFALAFTVLRVINFAHPDTFMVGMFGGLLAGRLIADNVIVVLLGGAVGAAAVGVALERLVIRPLRGRDVLMTLIGTLGVAIMLQNGMAAFMGPDPVAYPPVLPARLLSLGPISLSIRQLANVAICILILAAISYYVRGTKLGRATRAVAERAEVAAAFGVDVGRVSQVSIVLASLMAGFAAVSVGMLYGSAWAFVGLLYGLKSFTCMLVAGNRYFEGVMVVAIALGVVEALVTGYVSSSLKDAVAFLVLIGVLYFRPNGLFGSYAT